MTDRLHREDLAQLACDYVAGDLAEEEAQAFRHLLPNSEQLQQEVAFWQAMQPRLAQDGRPPGARPPGAGFNQVLRQRLQREAAHSVSRSRHAPSWLPNLAAGLAAAVLLVAGLGLWALPFERQSQSTSASPTHAASGVYSLPRELAGIEAVPARANLGSGRVQHGLQVVHVQPGGPADRLGIRPGDMILAVEGQSVRCARHFAAVIAEHAQGAQGSCRVRVYRPQMQRSDEYELRLDLAYAQ